LNEELEVDDSEKEAGTLFLFRSLADNAIWLDSEELEEEQTASELPGPD
jgi:hypothetical protein